ncbi:MAG: hypothetical protein F4Y80_10750 [Caldilineaceae bacterium SB0665_bin_21]|nr:hypothetical protein [Caldilineaceae bacterium SB0665_bin_21]MYC62178.1 hypothetical protein [Caldilineaceae bacterium SB0661_bin_34]
MSCRSAAPSPPWGCAASFVHPAAGSYPTRSQDLGQPKLSSAKLDFVQLDVSVQLSADTTISILFVGLFALGVALLPVVRHVRLNLEDLLLGQVLGASQVDVVVTAILTTVVAVVLYGLHSRLLFISFDPLGAKVAGWTTCF